MCQISFRKRIQSSVALDIVLLTASFFSLFSFLLCRYGYAAALLFGIIGYGIAVSEKKEEHNHPKQETKAK
jgi:hypothetical protein